MQSAPDRPHMASEERRRLHSPRLPGQLMTHTPTGRSVAPLDGRSAKLSMKHQTHQKLTASGITRLTRYFDLDEEKDEVEEPGQEEKPLDAQDEELLDQEFKKTEEIGCLLAFTEVTVMLSPGQALGLHLDGMPVTASAALEIPLSTKVTTVEPHGLLLACCEEPSELTMDDWHLRLAAVDGKEGIAGVIHLKGILLAQQGDASPVKITFSFCREAKFTFNYKHRRCVGTALHIAALHRNGSGLLERLLESRADPQEEFHFNSRGSPGSAQAIHLAASRKLIGHMNTLLEHGANVDATSKVNGQNNYTALHEAASYGLSSSVSFLLQRRADPNALNLKRHTPLHAAARQGDVRLCQLLKFAGADLKAKDQNGATPVILAVERGRFRFDKLFLLMEKSFEDLLLVSQLCASVGSEVMRDKSTNRVHRGWREALVQEATRFPIWATDHWMAIMNNSPGAGEDILDVLTALPEAQNDIYNPIPRRARLPFGKDMLCRYENASIWAWDSEFRGAPLWQSLLCPGVSSGWTYGRSSQRSLCEKLFGRRGQEAVHQPLTLSSVQGTHYLKQEAKPENTELVPVKVRQLKLPGIINPDVMDILAFTTNHNILNKPTGQAIIQFAWDHIGRYYYWPYVLYQMVIIGNLVAEVLYPPETFWGARVRWSLLAVLAHLEFFYEFWEMCGFLCYLQHGQRRYLTNIENWYNWMSIGMLIVLVYMTMNERKLEDMPDMLSLLVLLRWIQFTWSCRAFHWVGEKILPIMQAFFSPHIGGILVVTIFVLLGFLHGAMALELAGVLPHHYAVVLGSIKLLLLGDGDGIDVTLQLGDTQEEGSLWTFLFLFVATVVFCVCVLNLFIAVHGEAYDSAQEKAFTSFLQERAGICLHCLLRPSWPPRCLPWRVRSRLLTYFCLQAMALSGWALMLREASIHALAPTALLCASAMLGDAILVQRPWNKGHEEEYYLWMCYKESFGQDNTVVERDDESDDGRIARLKRDTTQLYKQLATEVTQISKRVHEQNQVLSGKVQGVESRLQGLESLMEDLTQNIDILVSGSRARNPHVNVVACE